jgi:hypothetical protein
VELIRLFDSPLSLREIATLMTIPYRFVSWRVWELELVRAKRGSQPAGPKPYSEEQAALLGYYTHKGYGNSKIAEIIGSNSNKVRETIDRLGLERTRGHHCRKFTVMDEARITTLFENGVSPSVIARAYGCTEPGVHYIAERKAYTERRHERERAKKLQAAEVEA